MTEKRPPEGADGHLAFEVSVNGKVQHVAGAEHWRHLWTSVIAHRILPDEFLTGSEDEPDLPRAPAILLNMTTSVSVPDGSATIEDQGSNRTSGNYPSLKLEPGDVVQIRIIKTDNPDEPEWQDPDEPRRVVFRNEP